MATTHQGLQIFPHRKNPNGTFDSICPECFRTIATQPSEEDLTPFEQSHHCYSDCAMPLHQA